MQSPRRQPSSGPLFAARRRRFRSVSRTSRNLARWQRLLPALRCAPLRPCRFGGSGQCAVMLPSKATIRTVVATVTLFVNFAMSSQSSFILRTAPRSKNRAFSTTAKHSQPARCCLGNLGRARNCSAAPRHQASIDRVRRLPEAPPPWRSPQGSAVAYRSIFDIHPVSS